MTPGRSNRAAHLFTARRLYLASPPESPINWGQVNLNLIDYHSDPMGITGTFWMPDITDLWGQQTELQSKNPDVSYVVCDMFFIKPHHVWVEASVSIGCGVIGWRESETTGEILGEKALLRQFPPANNGILAGDDPALDMTITENDLEMNWEVEKRILPRMAKAHHFLEMWQGNQNLHATQKESHAQNKQRIAAGYISDTEEIVNAPGQAFNLLVWLHLYFWNDHVCPQLCLHRSSLEDGFKYYMSVKYKQSTINQLKVMRIVHLISIRTLKIGLTGMVSWIIQMRAMMTGRQTWNVIWS